MTRPSIGVKPIVVSTQTPSRTAASDAPAPRWQLTTRAAGGAPRGVGVREAVEAEAPQAEALAPLPRQGVGRGRRRQRRVKRGVEAGDRGHVGQGTAHGGDAGQRGGLVQRGEVAELAQRRHDVVVDEHGLAEARAAVHDAVADGVGRGQLGERRLERLALVRRRRSRSASSSSPGRAGAA